MTGKKNKFSVWSFSLCLLLIGAGWLGGCSNTSSTLPGEKTYLPLAINQTEPVATIEIDHLPSPTLERFQVDIAAFTASPSTIPPTSEIETSTSTPDLRQPPEAWQTWPVVPERVSSSMKEIYQQGLRSGNNPRAFSKIGDCQNVTSAFLGIYDRGGYSFSPEYAFLKDTIKYFSGSFGRESQAVRGGFNVASVLSSLWSDRQACLKGETPLDCEFRLWKPSIVFISMETWFPGRTAETYEKYLRKIIEFVISRNAVPILATKADNTEGDHSINATIVKLAYEYDIPLWNFWLAVQPLKDHGIDWARDSDGFHITVEAWNKRSFTALQALDAVWKYLNKEEVVPDLSPQPTLSNTPTAIPQSPTIQAIITPEIGLEGNEPVFNHPSLKGKILFNLAQRVEGKEITSGIFQIRVSDPTLHRLTEPGYRLEDVSSVDHRLLVSRAEYLYITNLNGALFDQISDHFFSLAGTSAYFLSEKSKVIYAGLTEGKKVISLVNITSMQEEHLPGDFNELITLFPSPSLEQVTWKKQTCDQTECHDQVWWSALNAPGSGEITEITNLFLSPSGKLWVFTTQESENKKRLYLHRGEGKLPKLLLETKGFFEHIAWSPDGRKLAVIQTDQSGYSGRILNRKYWLINLDEQTNRQLSLPQNSLTQVIWSADNQLLLFIGLESENDQLEIQMRFMDAQTRRIILENDIHIPWGTPDVYLNRVFWISDD